MRGAGAAICGLAACGPLAAVRVRPRGRAAARLRSGLERPGDLSACRPPCPRPRRQHRTADETYKDLPSVAQETRGPSEYLRMTRGRAVNSIGVSNEQPQDDDRDEGEVADPHDEAGRPHRR